MEDERPEEDDEQSQQPEEGRRRRPRGLPKPLRSAKNLASDALGKARDAKDTFMGRTVEEKIDEYSELYTQVLLGVRKDVEMSGEEVAALRGAVQRLVSKATSRERELSTLRVELERVRTQAAVWRARGVEVAALRDEVQHLASDAAAKEEAIVALRTGLERLNAEASSRQQEISTLHRQAEDLRAGLVKTILWKAAAAGALALSVLSLGGVLWMAL